MFELLYCFGILTGCFGPQGGGTPASEHSEFVSWRDAEAGILANHVQLTFADRFVKAGESYFSPDESRIIFQAIEVPEPGAEADEFYAMFVADVKREAAGGRIIGIENIRRLSPKGSANTCGWFHPTDPNRVIFGSTIVAPTESDPPGFERTGGRYRWMFPPEMKIVSCDLRHADGTAGTLDGMVASPGSYVAECSFDSQARYLLYCSLESNEGDLFVRDMHTDKTTRLVGATGYDGGPFFSPDGKRICYRSDRRGNDLLQLFIGELAFNDEGEIVGLEREFQLTDDDNVNWCPYWHPSGRFLVFSSSRLGHSNYEVFMIDADPGNLPGSNGTTRYGTRLTQITHAADADVLPAFNADGSVMIWTSKRGDQNTTQVWAADFVFDPDTPDLVSEQGDILREPEQRDALHVTDPDTGLIYIYNMKTHKVSVYDPQSHQQREVADAAELERVMRLFDAQDK